jgi:hypothetical protein
MIFRDVVVTAPCIGDSVAAPGAAASVAALCSTGHLGSIDTFCSLLPGEAPRLLFGLSSSICRSYGFV